MSEIEEKEFRRVGGKMRGVEVEGRLDEWEGLVKNGLMDKELKEEMEVRCGKCMNVGGLVGEKERGMGRGGEVVVEGLGGGG